MFLPESTKRFGVYGARDASDPRVDRIGIREYKHALKKMLTHQIHFYLMSTPRFAPIFFTIVGVARALIIMLTLMIAFSTLD